MTREAIENADWEKPLGAWLPAPGYPRVPIVPALAVAIVTCGLVALLAFALHGVLFPAKAVGARLAAYPSLQQAALAWRGLFAAERGAARSVEIWHDEASGFSLVRAVPPNESQGDARSASGTLLFRRAAEIWAPSLLQLSEALQIARLGEEQLSRGAILVALKLESPNESSRLVASSRSPLSGHERESGLGLVPYDQCLPVVDATLAGAALATPMNPKPPNERVYWSVHDHDTITVLATDPCGERPLVPLDSRSATIPVNGAGLITFHDRLPEGPFVLILGDSSTAEAPQLLRYYGREPQRLERITSIDFAPFRTAADSSGELYDSFERGLPGTLAGEPRVAARLVAGAAAARYLTESEGRWRFSTCAEPHAERYKIQMSNCEDLITTHIEVPLPRRSTECEPAPEGGWNCWDWISRADGKCDIRLIADPCGNG